LEISVPSILPYFIAIGHGGIWWFSEVSPHHHPSPNGATLFTEEGLENGTAASKAPFERSWHP